MTAPQQYRTKPIVVEAMQWDCTDERSAEIRDWVGPDAAVVDTDHIQHLWDYDAGAYKMPNGKWIFGVPYQVRYLILMTVEGNAVVRPGHWVVKEEAPGGFEACADEVFAQTYEPAPVTPDYSQPDASGQVLGKYVTPVGTTKLDGLRQNVIDAAIRYHWSELAGNVAPLPGNQLRHDFDRAIEAFRLAVGLSGVDAQEPDHG